MSTVIVCGVVPLSIVTVAIPVEVSKLKAAGAVAVLVTPEKPDGVPARAPLSLKVAVRLP